MINRSQPQQWVARMRFMEAVGLPSLSIYPQTFGACRHAANEANVRPE